MTAAVQTYADVPHRRDREDLHARILDAARSLYERNGTSGFSLSAVAAEAKLARATIYAHFSSRKLLLAQISQPNAEPAASSEQSPIPAVEESVPDSANPPEAVPGEAGDAGRQTAEAPPSAEPSAEPETALPVEAAPEQSVEPAAEVQADPVPEPQPELVPEASAAPVPEAQAEPAAENADEPVAESPDEPVDEKAAELTLGQSDEPAAAESEGSYARVMRAQAEALDHIARRVIFPKSLRREGTEAVLTRVEARLSVVEKTQASFEQTVGERLKTITADTSALAASLQDTRVRIERFEERQQAALAQLRLEVHNLTHQAGAPAPVPEPPIEPVPAPAWEPAPPPAAEPESAQAEPVPSRVQPYLSSARAAAIQAAQKAAERPKRAGYAAWLRMVKRWRWPLLAIAGVLVAGFDLFVFLHYQPAGAAVAPQSAPAAAAPVRHRALTPQQQLSRGLRYLNGTGVPMNVEKAARWLERSARNGQPVAQNYMGVLYQTGTGVAANMATAIAWYESAARAGNLKAMTNLGKAYAGGWPEGIDYAKAAEWFGRAAGFGDVDAQFNLAVLYERGAGVIRSEPDAYKWYLIAGSRGDANAAARAAAVASELTPNEQLAAQSAAALFRPAMVDSAANDVPR